LSFEFSVWIFGLHAGSVCEQQLREIRGSDEAVNSALARRLIVVADNDRILTQLFKRLPFRQLRMISGIVLFSGGQSSHSAVWASNMSRAAILLPSKEILDGKFRFAAIDSGAIRSHMFHRGTGRRQSKLTAFQDAKDETVSP
jgi:hypothetical protein